jgi:hypothetical protein
MNIKWEIENGEVIGLTVSDHVNGVEFSHFFPIFQIEDLLKPEFLEYLKGIESHLWGRKTDA